MPSRNRGRGDPLDVTNLLLNAADTFTAKPAEEVMDDLGLSRETAEDWQRICAELAQLVRIENGLANSRPRPQRGRPRDPDLNQPAKTDATRHSTRNDAPTAMPPARGACPPAPLKTSPVRPAAVDPERHVNSQPGSSKLPVHNGHQPGPEPLGPAGPGAPGQGGPRSGTPGASERARPAQAR